MAPAPVARATNGPARRGPARPAAVWATGLGALALFVALAVYLRPLDPGVLELQMAYTPRAFGGIVHQWSAEQLARYRAHLPADGLLLLLYGSFGWLLARRTRLFARWPRWAQQAAAWWLPLAAACDAAEDLLHAWLTALPRFGMPAVYLAAAGCSLAKWLLLGGFALLAAVALWQARDDDHTRQ